MDDTGLVATRLAPAAQTDSLPWRIKLGYSVGHAFNDLCASMWFTYLLVYFHFVLNFTSAYSGIILLVGQVADALSTPFVGLEVDRTDDGFLCLYGRKKTWHLLGTLCVLISFPFIFMRCLGCEYSTPLAQLIYYSAFVIVFQFGWASVQISHLSLIPDLTKDPHQRTQLNAFRYALTVSANICVFGVTWLMLGLATPSSTPASKGKVGPEDAGDFRNVVFIIIGVGALTSLLFHVLVKESRTINSNNIQDESLRTTASELSSPSRPPPMSWKNWFTEVQYYQVGALYMFTRLFINLAQVYMPLYLQDTLNLKQESIAIIPLVSYVSGFMSSFLMEVMNRRAGRQITYFLGSLCSVGACVWLYFGDGDIFKNIELYFVAVLLGVGCSTMLITSLSITADLIGDNVESGGFVYGSMSFTDKLSNGVAIMLLQSFHPCPECCNKCAQYYRHILSLVCGGAVVLALLVLLSLAAKKIGERKRDFSLLVEADSENPSTENAINILS